MKKIVALSLAGSLGLFVAACGDGGKAAAEEGLSAAQSALDAAKPEGVQYAPDIVEDIEKSLTAARGTFANGNFRQALAEAQLLPKKMAALETAVSAKKGELSKEWSGLSASLPEIVDDIQSRVDILSKSARLPAGVTKEAFNSAKAGAEDLARTWAEASDALTKGNVGDAVTKAQMVKAKAVEVMTSLRMSVPDALK